MAAVFAALSVFALPSADACIRFKAPGGSVDPGQRDPAAPEETPTEEEQPEGDPAPDPDGGEAPTTPAPGAPPPPPPTPVTGPGTLPGGGAAPEDPGVDNSTWETWWELNRVEFFPRRWVKRAITPEEGQRVLAGPQPLHPKRVAAIWPILRKLTTHKHIFVQESALITMGRTAANEEQRAEARELLIKNLRHRKKDVARAAALGLFYVADDSSVFPMYEIASDKKVDEEIRAFVALTLTNLRHPMASVLLQELADIRDGHYELVSAALMGLGYIENAVELKIPDFLKTIAFGKKKVRAEYRAVALESLGRIGDFEAGRDALMKGILDRDVHVRRSASIALGVLDYRTSAEREIRRDPAPPTRSTRASRSLPSMPPRLGPWRVRSRPSAAHRPPASRESSSAWARSCARTTTPLCAACVRSASVASTRRTHRALRCATSRVRSTRTGSVCVSSVPCPWRLPAPRVLTPLPCA